MEEEDVGIRQVFDGKRIRKAIKRRPCDYNHLLLKWRHERIVTRGVRDLDAVFPVNEEVVSLLPPASYSDNSSTSYATKHLHTKVNKDKCAVYVARWTPDARRLITGTATGEFTLWNGINFNFETIQQAHDTAVRAMEWTHDGTWMVSADDDGYIKYWQTNFNNVKAWRGHSEPVRGLSVAPTDLKLASCSDDRLVKIWDFHTGQEERVFEGFSSVKCLEWHPSKSVIVCGGKDHSVRLWDARSGRSAKTFHVHKRPVMATRWSLDGTRFASAAQDQVVKVIDIRTMTELQTLSGHNDSVMSLAWHPVHPDVIATGGYNGHVVFWSTHHAEPQAFLEHAHDQAVWTMDWHPLGHILATGSNDNTTKFWARSRPGDSLIDRYNCAQVPGGEDAYEELQQRMVATEDLASAEGRRVLRDYRPRERTGAAGASGAAEGAVAPWAVAGAGASLSVLLGPGGQQQMQMHPQHQHQQMQAQAQTQQNLPAHVVRQNAPLAPASVDFTSMKIPGLSGEDRMGCEMFPADANRDSTGDVDLTAANQSEPLESAAKKPRVSSPSPSARQQEEGGGSEK